MKRYYHLNQKCVVLNAVQLCGFLKIFSQFKFRENFLFLSLRIGFCRRHHKE